jgi:hypothetical protein
MEKMSKTTKNKVGPLGVEFDPLVECAICQAVVGPGNAQTRWVNIGGKPVKVWVCQTCLRFSRGYQVEKYVMKEEKTP